MAVIFSFYERRTWQDNWNTCAKVQWLRSDVTGAVFVSQTPFFIDNVCSHLPPTKHTLMQINNVLVPTAHGLMIINRHETNYAFGVSKFLVEDGVYEAQEVGVLREVIKFLPVGCVLLDVGANIGVHTLEFARACQPLGGTVHAFEAQRIIFQMLAGNAALECGFK